jgi:hypothetical protein
MLRYGLARPTDRTSFKREAERTLPHRVDIPVPGTGLGRRLTDMLAWCRNHIAAGTWAPRGESIREKAVGQWAASSELDQNGG